MSFAGRNFGGRVMERYTANRNTRWAADAASFTYTNFVAGTTINATLSAIASANGGVIPVGVLGGSVVCIKGNGIAGPPTPSLTEDLSERPLGVVLNDAAGNSFESVNLSGAGVHVYIEGPSTFEIAVFETNTRDVAGVHTAGLITYTAGDRLFMDINSGLLTNVHPISAVGGANDDFDSAAFDPTDVGNGIFPEVLAEVIEVDVGGGSFMAIRWLK